MKASSFVCRHIGIWAVAIFSLLITSIQSRAGDDIRIYLGVVKTGTFFSGGHDSTKDRTYLVVNQTAKQVALITVRDRTTSSTTMNTSVLTTVPNQPIITKDSRTFIYVSSSEDAVPVNTYRWLSSSAPGLVRLSPTLEVLAAKRLEYLAMFYAFAAFNSESSGTFTFSKSLTLEARSADHNTASAIVMVEQYLRDRNMID